MLPGWTFGLLLGFHVDQRGGTLPRVLAAAGKSTRPTCPISKEIGVICGLTSIRIEEYRLRDLDAERMAGDRS
jgi:hypothetical protein